MPSLILSEDQECQILADYCRLKNYTFCHINNEFYTKSWKQKNRQLRLGSAKGFPDYLIIVNNKLIAIEMKRVKGGVISQYQKEWIEILNNAGVPTIVAKGAESAIAFIKSML